MNNTTIAALNVNNISKSFNNAKILENISLAINHGEFVSLIGPTGCGKSTLFSLISGIDEPTVGTIALHGSLSSRQGKVGYMMQDPLLLPWRTVEENVILGLEIRGIKRESALKKARKLLDTFGLASVAQSFPYVLSGGMAQKVALLRTVLFNNSLLLLDEPFGSLDALTRLSMQLWLLSMWEKLQASVLFITHDIREAILLSDRILVMSHRPGRIIEDIEITLPRPRKFTHLRKPHALALEEKLLSLLLEEKQK